MKDISKRIAQKLLEIHAVFLRPREPFTWASGIKSPIYCDNRLILTSPDTRDLVEEALAQTIGQNFPRCQLIMGTATAGIPHAAIAGHILGLPMGYVRGSAKGHGRTNRVEGRMNPGDKVVVVEDLISTAGSVLESVEALEEAGGQVIGIVSIFSYSMKKGRKRLLEKGIPCVSLATLDDLVQVAAEKNYIEKEDVNRLLKFRDDPTDESWMTVITG